MPSRNLADACTLLRDAIPELIAKYNSRYSAAGLSATVGEVLRTAAEQQAKYQQGRQLPGRIVTNADGINHLSRHQAQDFHGEVCSHAVDINVMAEGKRYVDDERWYHALLGIGICVGLYSGGSWAKPDWPHLTCVYAKE